MILSGQSIRILCHADEEVNNLVQKDVGASCMHGPLIEPFCERTVNKGKTHGLSVAGYDIRVKLPNNESSICMRNGDFLLASSIERIRMPNDLLCIVHDKSSWAREGLALQNTVLEPGWEGWITLEITFHRPAHKVLIHNGDPIAQLIFHKLDMPAERPYDGKYQNQPDRAVEAIHQDTDAPTISPVESI